MTIKKYGRTFSIALVGYAVLFIAAKIFFEVIVPAKGEVIQIYSRSEALTFLPLFLISFLITFTIIIYLFNSLLEKKWIPLHWTHIILYTGTLGALGPTGEVLIHNLSIALTGEPLWIYQLLPVHGGATSLVMALVWPLYGFHIYCFHTALKTRHDKVTNLDLSLFIGFDAITLEVLVNIFTLYFFYTYIFYYIAGDLNHLSTIVIFIPYILCGYITVRLLHKIERAHHKVILGLAGFLWGWFVIFIL